MIEAQDSLVLQEPTVSETSENAGFRDHLRQPKMYFTLNHWELSCQARDQGGKDDLDNQVASCSRN